MKARTSTRSSASRRQPKLVRDVKELKGDVAKLYSDLTHVGRSGVEAARMKLESLANDRLESMEQMFRTARARGRNSMASIQSRVEANPLACLFVSFGIGFLIGKVLHRRR